MTYTEEWIEYSGTNFYTRTYLPETMKGAILVVHGFIEHAGRWDWAANKLRNAGYAVLTYDQRGYGRTALDKEHKHADAAYGKTSRPQQLDDIGFFLALIKDKFKTDQIFIYGHSMGGALALSYACIGPDHKQAKASLKGIIATSPLVRLTNPPPTWQRFIGGYAAKLLPGAPVPAPVAAKALCQDPTVAEEYLKDPLVIERASILAIGTMLDGGEDLERNHYKQWPKSLPVLIVHGGKDEVTSPIASKNVYDRIDASDKLYVPYPEGLHELHNEPAIKEDLLGRAINWLGTHNETRPKL